MDTGNALYKRSSYRAAVAKLQFLLEYSIGRGWPDPNHSPLWFFWTFGAVCHIEKSRTVVGRQWRISICFKYSASATGALRAVERSCAGGGHGAHPCGPRTYGFLYYTDLHLRYLWWSGKKGIKKMPHLQKFSFFTAWLDGSPYRTGGTVDRTDRRKPWRTPYRENFEKGTIFANIEGRKLTWIH